MDFELERILWGVGVLGSSQPLVSVGRGLSPTPTHGFVVTLISLRTFIFDPGVHEPRLSAGKFLNST